ncbi:DUF3558 domain-containing protein [Nocardia cerradoensis]|uniref:DUF3558 domain-containing protein n=1 Tax=Nocardia cerradoensis TaxID=85688 RepID=UPI000A0084C9|nr:DUF3558 domain-containing protein [Nocardia cerradoensis]NKY44421.1 DUF3558 domain-containing protein [Nocardia cerradoensis]
MRGDQREASVIRKAATAVLAAAVVLVGGGCSSSTSGTASPETSDPKVATAALWDPCTQVSDDVLRQVGADPSTRESGVGGVQVDGWKVCSWSAAPMHARSLVVWSTTFSLDDIKNKQDNVDFTAVTVAGRQGWKFHRASDRNNEKCDLVFPAATGAYQLSFYNNDPGDSKAPCDSVMAAAQDVVPLFPK